MNAPVAVETLLHTAVDIIEKAAIRYAVVGALARNAWGRPRTTMDVDLAVMLDAAEAERLQAGFFDAGFVVRKVRRGDDGDPVPELLLLAHASDAALRVDLLIAKTPFEMEAIGRRRLATVYGRSCHVVTPEDLVVYKVVSGRSQDLADVEDVARTRREGGQPIDWTYVERWAAEFGVEARLRDLRSRVGD